MNSKPTIILKEYDSNNKEIILDIIQQGKTQKDLVRKGMTVDEFKIMVRKKYGNDVEIINKISKKKEWTTDRRSNDADERFSSGDIRDAMKNDFARGMGLPKF